MDDTQLEVRKVEHRLKGRSSRTKWPRLYMWPEGEGVLENLFFGRRNRPIELYRSVLPQVFERLGLPADTKARWSQYAGCSCPCSPGFILTHHSLEYHPHNFVVIVGRTEVDEQVRVATYERVEELKEEGDPGLLLPFENARLT